MRRIFLICCVLILTGCAKEENQPDVIITTQYENYSVSTNKNSTEIVSEEVGKNYILNTNSLKFHTEGCFSAEKILDENREEVYMKRQEIIDMGYTGCGNCNPR